MLLLCIDFSKFIDARIVLANDASGAKREGVFIPFLPNGFYISGDGCPWLTTGVVRIKNPLNPKRKFGIFLRPSLEALREMSMHGLVDYSNVKKTGLLIGACFKPEPIGFAYVKVETDGKIL